MGKRQKAQDRLQDILGEVVRLVSPAVAERGLPKELMTALLASIEKGRDGLLRTLSQEITRLSSRVDIQRLIEEILRNHKIRVEIHLEPKPKKKRGTRQNVRH